MLTDRMYVYMRCLRSVGYSLKQLPGVIRSFLKMTLKRDAFLTRNSTEKWNFL